MAEFLMDVSSGAMVSLLEKLGTMLVDEYLLFRDVRSDIMFLKGELEAMQAFLLMMADVEEPDRQAKLRANAVRELSYDIEDKIDKFVLLVDHESGCNSDSFRDLFNKIRKKINYIKARYKIAKDFKDIKSQLKDVTDRYGRYTIDESSMPRNEKVDPRLMAIYKDASELVGVDGPTDALVQLLSGETGESESSHQVKVASIVGCGGLGKTTLARQVYNRLGANFQCRAFVSISRRPDMTKILSSLLSQLRNEDSAHAGPGDLHHNIEQIRNFLEGKRYFVVIDDIWDKETWRTLDCALLKNNLGSIIVTTTRIHGVATSCSSQRDLVYVIEPLSAADSKTLFFKRIFGCEENCPTNLIEASEDILKKCGGLPLAINAISSLLATRETKEEWDSVRLCIGFTKGRNSDIDAMNYILSLSYFDLPLHLRSCLLYFAMFPEDLEIKMQRLVHIWISEGFIHGKDGQDLVQLGERYFYELVNRSLIQLVDEPYCNGKVLYCQVHDTVLDFLIYKSMEENFCTLVSKHSKPDSRIRRLSLTGNEDQGSVERLDLSHARSLIHFGNADQLPSVVKLSSLRMLDLSWCSGVENNHIKGIARLFQLKYLSICSANVSELPRQIGDCVYLETLDASHTKVVELPESVTRLKHLVRLFVPEGTQFPDGIGKMVKLQEIGSFINIFKQSLKFLDELGKLADLRKITITWDTDELDRARWKGEMLVFSLNKLQRCKLHSLSIEFNLTENDATLLAEPPFFLPALESIREVKLRSGRLSWIENWLLSLVNLERLSLFNRQDIEQQDVDMIGSISSLREFVLWGSFAEPIVISSSSRVFQHLQVFEFGDDITKLIIEPGAMQDLRDLVLWVDLRKFQTGVFHGDGFLRLSSLAHFVFRMICIGVTAEYEETLEESLQMMVRDHPNHPSLQVWNLYGDDRSLQDEDYGL